MFRYLDRRSEKASGGAGPVFRWIWAFLIAATVAGMVCLMAVMVG